MKLMKKTVLIAALAFVAVSADAKKGKDVVAEQIEKARSAEATFAIPADAATAETENADLKELLQESKLVASAGKETAAAAAPATEAEETVAASAAAMTEAEMAPTASSNEASVAIKAPAAEDISKKAENEIPVLAAKPKAARTNSGAVSRILASLGILCLVLIGTTVGLKRFAKSRQGKTQHTAIKVLTQHHIGPKKTLAIVQVAGESILIGVTDHSITMLKSLALLDEEVPGQTPSNFDSMMDMDEQHQPDFALRGLDGIRDSVSKRLRGMKEL